MTEPPSPLRMLLSRHTRRREFITLLGGATVAWPLVARAQQGERMRRVGIFMDLSEQDVEGQTRVAAFRKGLQDLGRTEGRNVKFDTRWTAGSAPASSPAWRRPSSNDHWMGRGGGSPNPRPILPVLAHWPGL